MKNLKVKNILFSMLAIMAIAVFLTSCQQENLIEDEVLGWKESPLIAEYPDEITIDNWRQFIHAPQEVIDYHTEKERQLNQVGSIQDRNNVCSNNSGGLLNSNGPLVAYLYGRVKAFDGQWRSIPDVNITMGQCITNSCAISGRNFSLEDNCGSELCMDFPTSPLNGVSTLDILLIERHIQDVVSFTEARQFIAADVNRDGIIDYDDTIAIRRIILGIDADWASSDNIVFVTFADYNDVDLSSVGVTNPCLPKPYKNRRAIKTGDVNGTFLF